MVHSRIHLVSTLGGVYKVETKNGERQRPLRPFSVLYAEAPSGANDIFSTAYKSHT